MSRFLLLSVAILLSLQAPLAGASAKAYAPAAVVAVSAPDTATLISWVPGSELADSFRVYGIAGGPVLLGEVSLADDPAQALNLLVPAGFATYAVSGVKAGAESQLVTAISVAEEDCIKIEPPDVAINCIPIIGWPLKVTVKLNLDT